MKQIIGGLILLLGAGLAVLLALVVLTIIWFAFFEDPRAGYDRQPIRRAQPRAGSEPGGLSERE
ncbi:hypothetical protein [Hymenobacter sp. UYP22]|uniref:hypothetical protein n=1 Tax=Hymenobacter sp. UYP22 TaxID=3156348 RepID=UPI0033942C73